jgi:hypothetical protein
MSLQQQQNAPQQRHEELPDEINLAYIRAVEIDG